MTRYLVGVDVGGTFTDCAVVDDQGEIHTAKALTTPVDQSVGVVDAIEAVAATLGVSLSNLLANTDRMVHGTTMGINAIVTRSGPPIGLIATKGHGEALFIMNGTGRTAGLSAQDVINYPETSLPIPIVEPGFVAEVTERVDREGKVVVPLDIDEAKAAVESLRARGARSIAVCFLWSFMNPANEREVKALIERADDIFVSASSDIAPKLGEYPRTATTVMNAYIGPAFTAYMKTLGARIAESGFGRDITYAQCNGGVMTPEIARSMPVRTLDSGPAVGVVGSAYLGGLMNYPNIICTDMGGTTFDVGLVANGRPVSREESILDRYQLHLPMIDVQSIGAGGGSIAWKDHAGGLRVGPASAGAVPGPACYGRGGDAATVTDADVVRGIIDPDNFLGGTMRLDAEAAHRAVGRIASSLGLGIHDAAAGITRIVDNQMADLVRRMSLYRGYDPRDFVVFAFGGAGPVHAGLYAQALGIHTVVVPLANVASVWSALGAACAEITFTVDRTQVLRSPFDPSQINAAFKAMEAEAHQGLARQGVPPTEHALRHSVFMKFTGQVFELEVDLPGGDLMPDLAEGLVGRFADAYEQRYGSGTAYRAAGVMITLLRVTAIGQGKRPTLRSRQGLENSVPAAATARPVYWAEAAALVDTPVYSGATLRPGHRLNGPAVVEYPHTTIALHPGHCAHVDEFGNVVIRLESKALQ
jgi:N-methylhydantoinase A